MQKNPHGSPNGSIKLGYERENQVDFIRYVARSRLPRFS